MEENIVLKLDNKGRLTIPLKVRKTFNLNPGDVFFVKPEDSGLHIARVENPFDVFAEYAEYERKEGKSTELRAYAKKRKIKL